MASLVHQSFNVFTPPPRYNVREWADEFRYLSSEGSSKPGKYRSAFAPYQREPMESINNEAVQSVVLMWASQVGKTETINNGVGYFIHADPAPQLVVQPTVEFAEAWSKERLVPMIRDTDALSGLVKDPRSRDSGNTILSKQYPGGNIAIVGANAPSGLAGRPRRVVWLDEVDRYPASAGTEGDPVSLAIRRTESFWNAVVVMTSTPTTKGISRIEKAFEQTDQRKWFVPCPYCGEHQVLMWRNVMWPDGKPELAYYKCEHCEGKWQDEERRKAVLAGEWRPTAEFNGKRGYWINGINSPFKHKRGYVSRLHQMAVEFLEAKSGGEETLKTWINTFLAETWESEGDSVDPMGLCSRREPYGPELPEGVLVLTASADVQADRIEAEIVGWGLEEENWGIKRAVFIGDTEKLEVFEKYRHFLQTEFMHPLYGRMRPVIAGIDARYKPKGVTEFARRYPELNVKCIMGAKGRLKVPVQLPSRKARFKAYQFDTHVFKSLIFARLKDADPGPRYAHFPLEYDEEFFLQLTGERQQKKYVKGFPQIEWVKTRERNEALDIRAGNHAVLWILQPNFKAIKSNLEKQTEVRSSKEIRDTNLQTDVHKPRLKPMTPRKKGFVGGWRQ